MHTLLKTTLGACALLALTACDSAEKAAQGLVEKAEQAVVEQARESLGIVNSQLGKHLAVYLYAGIFKAVNKLAVAAAVDAGRSIDTRNP